jgi:hypothetical protein
MTANCAGVIAAICAKVNCENTVLVILSKAAAGIALMAAGLNDKIASAVNELT